MSDSETSVKDLTIEATDGRALAASLYEPERDSGSGVVLITSAMGVLRSFYDDYARYLAGQGLPTLTVDYRGMGGSKRGPLSGESAGLEDWAERDIAGAISWLTDRFPVRPLLYMGHSMGIQLLGLTGANSRVAAAIGVSCPSAYWKHWRGLARLRMFALWHLVFPIAVHVLGYLPARRMGLGRDLPPRVALDWARWSRHADYIVDRNGRPMRKHFRAYSAPLRIYSFTDDDMAPRHAVEDLLSFYGAARIDHRHLEPGELGVERVGHVGFFRPALRDTLWQESADWLLEMGRAAAGAEADESASQP